PRLEPHPLMGAPRLRGEQPVGKAREEEVLAEQPAAAQLAGLQVARERHRLPRAAQRPERQVLREVGIGHERAVYTGAVRYTLFMLLTPSSPELRPPFRDSARAALRRDPDLVIGWTRDLGPGDLD